MAQVQPAPGEWSGAPNRHTMKRMSHFRTCAAALAAAILLSLAQGDIRVHAQNRMAFSIVPAGSRPRGARARRAQARRVRHVHAGAGASRRRAQRAVRAVHARHGAALRSTCRPTAATAARTRSAPSCSSDIGVLRTRSCCRRTASTAPSSTSRAPSTTATRSIPQEVIEKWGRDEIVGDFVRLIRTLRPDVVLTMNIQGRGGDRAHEATDDPGARGVFRGRRSDEVSGADPGRPAAVAAEEAVLQRRPRCDRRGGRGGAVAGGPAGSGSRLPAASACAAGPPARAHARQHRRLRRAARPHVRRDRRRRAQQSQVPGHRRACRRCPGSSSGRGGGGWRRRLSADGHRDPRADGEGRDVAVRRHRHDASPAIAQFAGADSARGADRRRSPRSSTEAAARAGGLRRGQRRRHRGADRSRA